MNAPINLTPVQLGVLQFMRSWVRGDAASYTPSGLDYTRVWDVNYSPKRYTYTHACTKATLASLIKNGWLEALPEDMRTYEFRGEQHKAKLEMWPEYRLTAAALAALPYNHSHPIVVAAYAEWKKDEAWAEKAKAAR